MIKWAGQNAIAIAALILSLVNMFRGIKKDKENKRKNKKAAFHAEFHEKDEVGEYVLRITNVGLSEARNVRVLLDGVAIAQHRQLASFPSDGPKFLPPGHSVEYGLAVCIGDTMPELVEALYDDDLGERHPFRASLR